MAEKVRQAFGLRTAGEHISVSGTTATHGADRCVAPGQAGAQTTYILDKIAASITALGGRLDDVVRTRIYVRDVSAWEAVSRAHGRVFGEVRPANTLIEVSNLVGDYEVEIEADAVLSPRPAAGPIAGGREADGRAPAGAATAAR